MPDDAGAAGGGEPTIQSAGAGTCPYCPSPPECGCPDTPEVCRTGGCVCGPECPCPGWEPPLPPWWPPCKRCKEKRRRRKARRLARGPAERRRRTILTGAGIAVLVLVVAVLLFLLFRSDDDSGDAPAPTTTTASVPDADAVPPATQAGVESVLDALGVTDPASRQAVLDALAPVDEIQVGQGPIPFGEPPDFVVPLSHGHADVTREGQEYVAFVTQVAAPVEEAGTQWTLTYAQDGAPLAEPVEDPDAFLGGFPQSASYVFDPIDGSGDLLRLDPLADLTEVPTSGMGAASGDVVIVIIDQAELEPGGDYALWAFYRATEDGQAPSRQDPTVWTTFSAMLQY